VLPIYLNERRAIAQFAGHPKAESAVSFSHQQQGRATTYNMVTHSNKQVKEQLPSLLHLGLHGTAALERVAAANYQSEVVATKLGVVVWGVDICPSGGGEDG
jgi:hypothetical protein